MRIVKRIALGLLLFLIAAFLILFLMGFRSSANHITATIVIDRPPARVWSWIAEPVHQKQWISWLVDSQIGETGQFHWVRVDPTMNNMRVEINGQRTAFDPPRTLAAHVTSGGMFDGDVAYTLAQLGPNQTRVDYDGRYHYAGFFARLMEPLITPQAQKKLDGDVARLKQLVEKVN